MRGDRLDIRQMPEAALVRAAQSRDQSAFAELVRRREGWLRGLLGQLCRDASEADDLAQEAFLRAWGRLGSLRDPPAFGAWLRQLAIRVFIDARRTSRFDIDPDACADDLTADAPAPDRAAAARIDLERALTLLSDGERVCIVLNLGEGLSHGEIVEIAGLPLGTVKSHILRGTAKLRRALGDEDG